MQAKFGKWVTLSGLADIEEMARGCGNKELAKKMGIATETLNRWQWKHPAISEAIERGRTRRKAVLEPEPVVLRRHYDKRPDLLLWCDGRRAV